MNVNIRAANIADINVICEFNRLLAKESENKDLDPVLLKAGVRTVLSDPQKGCYFVAEVEGRIVGQLGYTCEWSDWRNGDFWWIQSVYVTSAARRQGIFRKLFEHILQVARSASHVIGVRLYVEQDNHIAQATYRQMGLEMTHYQVMEKFPLVGT